MEALRCSVDFTTPGAPAQLNEFALAAETASFAGASNLQAMRVPAMIAVLLLGLLGCANPDHPPPRNSHSKTAGEPPAKKAGKAAHQLAREAREAAQKADQKLREAAHQAREGWKEAERQDREKQKK